MSNSFDWLFDLQTNFRSEPYLATLKEDKFFGSIEINFEAGIPKTVNFKRHIKSEAN